MFVFPTMRQQRKHDIGLSAMCFANCTLQFGGAFAVSYKLLLLKDQADQLPIGTREFSFQRHAVAARLRRS